MACTIWESLLLGQVLGPDARVNFSGLENIHGVGGTNAIDIAQCHIDSFVRRNFYTNNTSHKKFVMLMPGSGLALALFVAFVRANHTDDTLPANDFAIFAQLLN